MAISNAGFGGKWKFQEIHPPKQFLMSYFDKFKPQKLVWLSFIDCSNIIVYQSRTPHSRDVGNNLKMRILSILFTIFILINCKNTNTTRDKNQLKFEVVLGKKESMYLNEIIEDFDNYLVNEYSNSSFKFKDYLKSLSNLDTSKLWKIDSHKLKRYKESSLFNIYETKFPDSVWYEDSYFKIIYNSKNLNEEIIPINIKYNNTNIDSILTILKQRPEYYLKEKSTFLIALDSMQNIQSGISKYINHIEYFDNISIHILANELEKNLDKKNEYFYKRILIMEMYN